MAVTFDSLATAKSKTLGFFRTLLGDWDLSSKGFFGKLAAVTTLSIYSFLRTARQIDNDATPSQNTSTAGLDEWATNGTGLSNGAGGYGRKGAVAATGGIATFSGTPGTMYAVNSTLTASDGVTKFILTAAVVIGGGGTASGLVNATTTGTAGNLGVGAVLTVDFVPVGGNGSATLTTGLAGGLESESNAAVLVRIQDRIRNPPKGGTAHDYRTWLESGVSLTTGLSLGIARAFVYPLRNGTGSVDAVITQAGSGIGRAPGSASSAQAYLDSVRPVTVTGDRVLLPYQPFPTNGLALVMRPTPTLPANAFQFDSTTGGPYTVAAGSTSSSIVLNANCADLVTQLGLGKYPLIQVIVTGQTLPQVATVTNYNAGTFTATITPAIAAPAIGDAVFAASPLVLPIATALLALVDALGPSRASGFADAGDSWQDTLAIDQMIFAALDVVDSTGVQYISNLLATPTINGVSTDKQGIDDGTHAPELLYAKSITVRP